MFKEKKYQIIKNAISYELANFAFNYQLLRRQAVTYMYDGNYTSENLHYGTFKDQQVTGVYAEYSDMVMETLLVKVLPILEKETDLKLMPTYSYMRVYEKGSILKKHKDRYSCEVSMTMNLGGDPWPIYLEPSGETDKEGVKIDLEPGDALIYRGCEVEHWREAFEGENCGQVFLHYNDASGENAEENRYDTRPFLGLPSWFKS